MAGRVVLRLDRAAAERLEQAPGSVMGADGWREAGFTRDIWYASILHFAAEIAQPAALIEWVAQRRELDLGHTIIDTAELVRFRFEDGPSGRLMRPEVLASVLTGSSRVPTADVCANPAARTLPH